MLSMLKNLHDTKRNRQTYQVRSESDRIIGKYLKMKNPIHEWLKRVRHHGLVALQFLVFDLFVEIKISVRFRSDISPVWSMIND